MLLLLPIIILSCSTKNDNATVSEKEEIMEVNGIVTSYNNDVMYIELLRTRMELPLRYSESTSMNIFPAPKDTVLLVYTGNLGDIVHLPEIMEIHTRPFKDTGSKVVNLKELKANGELITRP